MSQYNSSHKHISIKHNSCGYEWNIKPSNFLHGRRCPKCAGNVKHTLIQAKEKYSNLGYDLMATEYINVFILMPFICISHKDKGIQYSSLASIRQGGGCRYCRYEKMSKSRRPKQNIIIQEFKEAGLILESGFLYTTIHDNLPCVCEKHPELGIQFKSLNSIRHGKHYGCVKCGDEKRSESKRISDIEIKILVESLGMEFLSTIKEGDTRVVCVCPKHKHLGVQIKSLCHLRNGQGCKYCSMSHGERKIMQYLLTNEIPFIAQMTFEGLYGINNGKLSYDFYIDNDLLVEFQGEQHKRFIKGLHITKDEFEKQQIHDQRKREYANHHNIKLLEIWYYDFDRIDKTLSEHLKRGVA